MAESTKFNKAVNRANGTSGADEGGGNENAVVIPNASGPALITKGVTKEEMEALVQSGEYEFAPQNMSLEEGDMIAGILEGNGPDAEFEQKDMTTGIVTTKVVQTWIIANADGSQRAGILSTAQLDRKLPPFVGSNIKIIRGKDLKMANGHRVTDYLVAGEKLKNGARRAWASKPVIETHEAAQLPAGQTAPTAQDSAPNPSAS